MTYIKGIFSISLLALVGLSAIGCKPKSSTEIICGGSMNFACPTDMYCNSKENCGGIDRNGVCALRPTQCKAENHPICGCDGETYSNSCLAAAKGVSQRATGECQVTPTTEEDTAEDTPEDDTPDEGAPGNGNPENRTAGE